VPSRNSINLNPPSPTIVHGHFRQTLEATGISVQKEIDTVALARRMDLFTTVYGVTPDESKAMAEAGADVIIAHAGSTIGGSIWVVNTACSLEMAAKKTQAVIDAGKSVRDDVIYLSHGGPILSPADAAYINGNTDALGSVSASSLERIGFEQSLISLPQEPNSIPVKRKFTSFSGS
jgi:predicted TIM-barrel enzyme